MSLWKYLPMSFVIIFRYLSTLYIINRWYSVFSNLRRTQWIDYTAVCHCTEMNVGVHVYSESSDIRCHLHHVSMQVSSSYCSNMTPRKISESEGVMLYNTIFGELTAIRFVTKIMKLIWTCTSPDLCKARHLNIYFGWRSVYKLMTGW
jgi:hypothetical protein